MQVIPRNDTIAGPRGRRGDQVGGYTLMHTADLRRVAPKWVSFSEDVRADPDVRSLLALFLHATAGCVQSCLAVQKLQIAAGHGAQQLICSGAVSCTACYVRHLCRSLDIACPWPASSYWLQPCSAPNPHRV